MQANWIGREPGVRVGFPYDIDGSAGVLRAFTTRRGYTDGRDVLRRGGRTSAGRSRGAGQRRARWFIEECKRGPAIEAELATQEKKGMPTGLSVRHPLTGEAVPVWVGNYVLMSYGEAPSWACQRTTNAIFEFAKKYGLPIKPVHRRRRP